MANFFLSAITTDKASIAAVRGDAQFGARLATHFNTEILPRFSSSQKRHHGQVVSDRKEPASVLVGERDVARVLGSYYDGTVVGIDTPPVVIPPRSTVFVSLDAYIDQLERMGGPEIVRLVNRFNRASDDCRAPVLFPPALCPVFHNGTKNAAELCIVKYWPLMPEDTDQVVRENDHPDGWGRGVKHGYQSPRMA